MKAASIQMASGSNIKANLLEAAKLIAHATAEGAELIVLPENFGMIGNRQEDVLEHREVAGSGPIQDFLAQQSNEYGITLAGGSVPIASVDTSRYRNALLVYNKGECIGRYDKIHLFDVSVPGSNEKYCESDVIEPGDSIVVVDTGTVRLGLAICYDLRFPEMFRLLQSKGAEVILLPAAFTAVTGKAHWHTLLKARAIENLCYIIASAQGGFHVNGRETYGHSLIIEPWGKILHEIDNGPGFALADISLDQQQQVRQRFPVLTHCRYSVNSQIE